ncbi:NACHT domain-containing protein [Actomonas aquatica]|uniref:NACHT domain-containing protein n=1 Tax=Actomonas aquatica TaxID=2866162 RepID=A0ABZ1C688_9BACT|nr:NACHT domain-containing protein [Opitutus sp. WL0086]WRQ87237.1 NACHT domain-containing protein [Opitutus sp. WL0086]
MSKIRDEVRELHPLLNKLFSKMQTLLRFEYTHGADEKGADFIIEKEDVTLRQSTYVGVIAKVGNIGIPELAKIYMQLDQCMVERPFRNGKVNIVINEHWVVTNGKISEKAKESIEAKYRGKSVFFLSRQNLVRLIDDNLPSYWTDLDLDVGDYLESELRYVEELDRSLAIVPDIDCRFYVEQNVHRLKEISDFQAGIRKRYPDRVDCRDEILENRLVYLEGDAGSGKSKLVRQIVRDCSDPKRYQDSPCVPVVVSAKDLLKRWSVDLETLLHERLKKQGAILLDSNINFIFLVDGLDEVRLSQEAVKDFMEGLRKQVIGNERYRILVTSRSNRSNMTENYGLHSWRQLELYPLTTAQIFKFIQHLCKNVTKDGRLFEDIKDSKIFREMPKNPIAAILLAEVLRQKVDELPSSLPELYSKYFEVVLGRWEVSKGLQSVKEYEALDSILMRIATYMLNNQLDEMSLDEAEGYFKEYLEERNLGVSAQRLLDNLSERFEIAHVDRDSNRFLFKHKTFTEFLHAKGLVVNGGFAVDVRAFDIYWVNSYYFYIGLRRDCPRVLEEISALAPESEMARWVKIDALATYMLAGYATPYSTIKKALRSALSEAADVLYDAIVLRKGRMLMSWSEMHLLWLFQYIFKNNYGYHFFKDAIEDIALDISSEIMEDEKKAFSLFLLNVTYFRITGVENLDYIMNSELDSIPLCIQFGIRHESGVFKTKNVQIKKLDKRIKKMLVSGDRLIRKDGGRLKGPSKMQRLLNLMYETPLSERKDQFKKGAD